MLGEPGQNGQISLGRNVRLTRWVATITHSPVVGLSLSSDIGRIYDAATKGVDLL